MCNCNVRQMLGYWYTCKYLNKYDYVIKNPGTMPSTTA